MSTLLDSAKDLWTNFARTVVPLIVGGATTWLTVRGVELDPTATASLSLFLMALFTAVYSILVNLLQRVGSTKWGLLLGSTLVPTYVTAEELEDSPKHLAE